MMKVHSNSQFYIKQSFNDESPSPVHFNLYTLTHRHFYSVKLNSLDLQYFHRVG